MKIDIRYLRPRKAALFKERYHLYDRMPSGRIAEVAGGRIIPAYRDDRGDTVSGVTDDGGAFVSDSHQVDFPAEVEAHASGLRFKHKKGSVVYMGLFNPHWGHFITDCLSTFWCMGKVEADRYVFSYFKGEEPELHPNIRQALELLGVLGKIEIVNEPLSYDRVYVPCKGMVPREYVLEESSSVYDRIISEGLKRYKGGNSGREKIILSRGRFPKALLNDLGTREIEKVFEDNGFVPVYPEQLTLVELIGILSGSKEVLTIAGTLAHDMLFAPQGSRLTVLEKYPNVNNYQPGIDILKHLQVTYIDAAWFIWSVSPGLGPFIMGDTPELRRYAEDNGLAYNPQMKKPSAQLRRYFRLYYRHYKRQWIMPEWLEPEIGLMREAYEAGEPLFGEWLAGRRPLFISDALQPRFLAKTLRRLLHR